MQQLMFLATISLVIGDSAAQSIRENDINFRVEAGSRTCFFERGKVGQMMETFYNVLDGQHGDLDINFEIRDPNGTVLLEDYKKPRNNIIFNVTTNGDYMFCMDNTYSMINSKLVFVNVLIEDNGTEDTVETTINPLLDVKKKEEGVLEWTGLDKQGKAYFMEVNKIIESLKRTLMHVVKARQLLDIHGAMKSRDNYMAFEDTFIVDVWSGFQITFMFIVGMLQVYMIKSLFNDNKSIY